jgi:hypothetical protein
MVFQFGEFQLVVLTSSFGKKKKNFSAPFGRFFQKGGLPQTYPNNTPIDCKYTRNKHKTTRCSCLNVGAFPKPLSICVLIRSIGGASRLKFFVLSSRVGPFRLSRTGAGVWRGENHIIIHHHQQLKFTNGTIFVAFSAISKIQLCHHP